MASSAFSLGGGGIKEGVIIGSSAAGYAFGFVFDGDKIIIDLWDSYTGTYLKTIRTGDASIVAAKVDIVSVKSGYYKYTSGSGTYQKKYFNAGDTIITYNQVEHYHYVSAFAI